MSRLSTKDTAKINVSGSNNFESKSTDPLSNASTNLPSRTDAKLYSPLVRARETIELFCITKSTSNLESLSLAFKSVYAKIKMRDEIFSTVKKHQHYVVFLNSQMLQALALEELSVIHNVIGSASTSCTVSYQTLLKGVPPRTDFPISLLITFHFFVLQSFLQMMSADVKSLLNGISTDNLLFWDVATLFLRGSNFDLCLSRSKPNLSLKYHSNALKMINGFAKLAKYVSTKIVSSDLDIVVCAFRFKAAQYQLLVNKKVENELPMKHNARLAPFARDLLETLTHYKQSVDPSTWNNMNDTCCLLIDTFPDKSLLTRRLITSPHSDNQVAVNFAFPEKSTDKTLIGNNGSLVGISKSAISSLVNIMKSMSISSLGMNNNFVIEGYVSYLKRVSSDVSVFEYSLQELVPLTADILLSEGLVQDARALSHLCFEFAEIHNSSSGYQQACRLDLRLLSSTKFLGSKQRSIHRIEQSICRLYDLRSHSEAFSLTQIYVTSLCICTHGVKLPEIVSACILHDNSSIKLFFGDESCLDPTAQAELFVNILRPLSTRLSGPSDHLLKDLMLNQRHEIPLEIQYTISNLFNADIAGITNPRPKSCIDYIFIAGILMNNYKSGKFDLAILKNVETFVLEWVETAPEPDLTNYFWIFHEIVICLTDMGCINSSILLVDSLKRSSFNDAQGLFQAETLLSRALLETSNLRRLPVVLKNCGVLFKKYHIDSRNGHDDLIELKLNHLEYYIRSRDENKMKAKFKEVKAIMALKSKIILGSEATGLSIKSRLRCLVSMARFSYLTSIIEFMSFNVLYSLQDLKLSVKLLNSVLRKVNNSQVPRKLERKVTLMLLDCLSLAFTVAKHLGLSKEAIHYANEYTKLNSSMFESPLKTYHHFVSVNFLRIANKQTEAREQFNMGCKNNWDSPSLNLTKFITKALLDFESKSINDVSSLQNTLEAILLEVQEARNLFVKPASRQVSSLLLEFWFLVACSSGPENQTFHIDNEDALQMLVKAVISARSKFFEAQREFGEAAGFGSWVMLLPNEIPKKYDSETFNQTTAALVSCRDILLSFAAMWPKRYPEITTMHDASTLMSACVFFLSQIGLFGDQRSKSLLEISISFKDLACSLPYSNQREILKSINITDSSTLLPELSDSTFGNELEEPRKNSWADLQKWLPKFWVVVTFDVCSISGDLMITRLDANSHHPSVFKVPFDRHNSNKKSFYDFLGELKAILIKSNRSTKSETTSSIRSKEDRILWWKLRFELDSLLENLLNTIESSTIAGLIGVFSPITSDTESFRSFEHNLRRIWNLALSTYYHLFKLDDISVHLFHKIVHTENEESTKLKLLADLINIIFKEAQVDSPVIARLLHAKEFIVKQLSELYVVNASSNPNEHLILIPSESCTLIPWESMRCLRNRSVSRMPSVSCLVDSLRKHKNRTVVQKRLSKNILYVLNPSLDLINTQNRFQPIFEKIECAEGISGKPPSEDWLLSNLYRTNLYVYLGHGGGEQYVRSSSLFKSWAANKGDLPTALLLGCSSSAYQEHGKLQPSSNVFDWLVCGSPAVMTSLWDITDKDIDIFSLSLFAEWGLFEPESNTPKTLSQALAKSRNKCTLKYLNGAAPVLHGLPLKFKSQTPESSLWTS